MTDADPPRLPPATLQLLRTQLINDRTMTTINRLNDLLPKSPLDLESLISHCVEAATKASDAGYHVESYRLSDLARQLAKRVDSLAPGPAA
jgi:hypothetical protein